VRSECHTSRVKSKSVVIRAYSEKHCVWPSTGVIPGGTWEGDKICRNNRTSASNRASYWQSNVIPPCQPATDSQTWYHHVNRLLTVKRDTTVPTGYWQSNVIPPCQPATDSQTWYHHANRLLTVKRTTMPTGYWQSNVPPCGNRLLTVKRITMCQPATDIPTYYHCQPATDSQTCHHVPIGYWQSKHFTIVSTGYCHAYYYCANRLAQKRITKHCANRLLTVKRDTTVPTRYWQSNVSPCANRLLINVLPLCQPATVKRITTMPTGWHSNVLPNIVSTGYWQSNVSPRASRLLTVKRVTEVPTGWQSIALPLCQLATDSLTSYYCANRILSRVLVLWQPVTKHCANRLLSQTCSLPLGQLATNSDT
jgi:hypothetical protein